MTDDESILLAEYGWQVEVEELLGGTFQGIRIVDRNEEIERQFADSYGG